MNDYAPVMGPTAPIVAPGEFVFAASGFDHPHIFSLVDGLARAGATLAYVHGATPEQLDRVHRAHPTVRSVADVRTLLDAPEVRLVASAAVPAARADLGSAVLHAGKDFLTAKPGLTTLAQLAQVRATVALTGRKYLVCYGERLLNEAAYHAGRLIAAGAIGRVVQVLNLAPHRLSPDQRPPWFFRKAAYGGVLTDIGSHQFEQFLEYTGSSDADVMFARVANVAHPEWPELEDFGEATVGTTSGASCYCRVDWLTPDGLPTWGDGRTFVLGTGGSLEVRKHHDFGLGGHSRIHLVDQRGEYRIDCLGRVGQPFFAEVIGDCLARTERAMTQTHTFAAAELALRAQSLADAARADISLRDREHPR